MADEQFEFANADDEDVDDIGVEGFGQSVLWGADWTVETIVAQLKRANIEINPRFQRRDAWHRGTKSRFIESVILGLPIPQIVLAERNDRRGQFIILDGKQRLLSLLQFTGGAKGENNSFGLSGLEIRKDLKGKKFSQLERDPTFSTDLNAFLSHTIRATIIRNWPSIGFLHVVFHRLNTGSLKLSAQELRQAVVSGEFTAFADDESIKATEVQGLLGRKTPDPRMRDVELLVRAIAFRLFLKDYRGRMKAFLDRTCDVLNNEWTHYQERVFQEAQGVRSAVRGMTTIFGSAKLARKADSPQFNRSIFDALIFYAADPNTLERMEAGAEQTRAAYALLIEDPEFQAAVESDTAGLPHTITRIRKWGELLSQAIGTALPIPKLQTSADGEHRVVI